MDDTTNRNDQQSQQSSTETLKSTPPAPKKNLRLGRKKAEMKEREKASEQARLQLVGAPEPEKLSREKRPLRQRVNMNERTPEETPEKLSREKRRSRRKRDVRARTISVKRLTKRELELGRLLYPETDYWKPKTRGDCLRAKGRNQDRPCPYVSCKYHLYIDVSPRTGGIKLNFPDIEVWEMKETCALDVADRGATTLEQVGEIMNLTRERIRQLELRALAKLNALSEMQVLREYVDEGPKGKRRLPMLTADDFEESNAPKTDSFDDTDEEVDETESPTENVVLDDFDL